MPISALSFSSSFEKKYSHKSSLDQNLHANDMSSLNVALPQVFDILCVYRFASILQMSN